MGPDLTSELLCDAFKVKESVITSESLNFSM